jgi:hypothetical protein
LIAKREKEKEREREKGKKNVEARNVEQPMGERGMTKLRHLQVSGATRKSDRQYVGRGAP